MDKVTFDMSEVKDFADHLVRTNSVVREQAGAVVRRSAVAATRDSKAWVNTSGKYTKHYRRTITTNEVDGSRGLAWEFGPGLGRKQAFLGKILELGTATNPPHPHLIPAGEKQVPIIQGAVARAVLRALKG